MYMNLSAIVFRSLYILMAYISQMSPATQMLIKPELFFMIIMTDIKEIYSTIFSHNKYLIKVVLLKYFELLPKSFQAM